MRRPLVMTMVAILACPPDAARADEIVTQGVRLSASVTPLAGERPIAGAAAAIRLDMTDAETGAPLDGIRPAAWLDPHESGAAPGCKAKIESFLQGGLSRRPRMDMNAWQVVSLDDNGGITVIDPMTRIGTTQFITRVPLDAPGEDWAFDEGRNLLHVTLPRLNRVVTIDTARWKVARKADLPARPHRIALQPDYRRLWVLAAEGGVTVLAAENGTVRGRIDTGRGPHAIAFATHGARALVTNAADGTATLIDTDKVKKLARIGAGKRPVAVAHSPLARAFYVADEQRGELIVIDDSTGKVRARPVLGAGLVALAVAPGGRWLFAADGRNGRLHILDTADNKIWRSMEVADKPYQISFTRGFAVLRLAQDGGIGLVTLAGLGEGAGPAFQIIPAGQTAPVSAGRLETAAALAPVPAGDGALIAAPGDRAIYYYMDGAVAPIGSFSTGRARSRGVMVMDRSLRRTGPGAFATTITLPAAGTYDLAVLLDKPRLWHCFTATVDAAAGAAAAEAFSLRFLDPVPTAEAGRTLKIRFETGEDGGSDDFDLRASLAPGQWRQEVAARKVSPRTFEAEITPPRPGAYYIYVRSPSRGWNWHQLPFTTVTVTESRP